MLRVALSAILVAVAIRLAAFLAKREHLRNHGIAVRRVRRLVYVLAGFLDDFLKRH
jgi:hypothetical protein